MPNCAESGVRVRRKRVARLMRMASICGVSRSRTVCTTRRFDQGSKTPDLVNRDFTGSIIDRL